MYLFDPEAFRQIPGQIAMATAEPRYRVVLGSLGFMVIDHGARDQEPCTMPGEGSRSYGNVHIFAARFKAERACAQYNAA